MGLDIEDYSGRDRRGQSEIRRDLQEIVEAAFAEFRVSIDPREVQETGDGALLLAPPALSSARLVADLPRELAARLARRNRDRTRAGALRVRLALGCGHVAAGINWAGDPVVETARILDAPGGREALRDAPEASVVLVLTEWMHRETVGAGARDLRPEQFAEQTIGAGSKAAGLRYFVRLLPVGSGHPREQAHAPAPPGPPAAGRSVGTNSGVVAMGDHSVAAGGDVHGTLSWGAGSRR
ncbi:hypothetical protein [Cryptosporangium arvum]|uniref:hypothetical protein n=1 Tax=Cryptosporangium arvum TaxID=80871 RepID=UPI0012ED2B9E|nr:hypothetical protein [Cryptosporangium arvum]